MCTVYVSEDEIKMAESMEADVSLSEVFQRGWDAQKKIEGGELGYGSVEFKACLSNGIQSLETATHMVNQLSLFSSNEELEEIATADLKYLLLPVLLGDLALQMMTGNRLETIQKARIYLVDFLQRCKSYAITSDDPPTPVPSSPSAAAPPPPSSKQSFEQMAVERTARIAKLREQKDMEKKLQDLTERLNLQSDEMVDEELVREHLLTVLKTWVYKCHDHICGIDREIELLENREKMMKDVARQPEAAPPPPRQPMKPIVITREMLKHQVFGAGYPSLPKMTVEEFYEQRRKEEEMKQESKPPPLEEEEEEDSEAALRKAREWDDYKDDHRRGWGNTKNIG